MTSWQSKYNRIPFAEKGRTEHGADCWGLACLVYKNELGIELPDYLDVYETTNDREALSEIIASESAEHWDHPKRGEEQPFDIIILDMRGVPMHVGIIIRKGFMIHCARGIGTTIESYDTLRWKHKVRGFARAKRD